MKGDIDQMLDENLLPTLKEIFSQQTAYQQIVMKQWKSPFREAHWLYMDGEVQFCDADEEKYHEPLVHPAMKLSRDRTRVLILGGGDGLAAREVLKYPEVTSITIVDLDPGITDLAKEQPVLVSMNKGSMTDPKVTIVNDDARKFVEEDSERYGVILIDLPDPDSVELSHLYSEDFYRLFHSRLAPGGILVTQASSPYYATTPFLCLLKTIRHAGFSVLPYHNHVPTFGEWGWLMGIREQDLPAAEDQLTSIWLKERILAEDFSDMETRFLNNDAMISMVHFGKGVLDVPTLKDIEVNTAENKMLYYYYLPDLRLVKFHRRHQVASLKAEKLLRRNPDALY